MTIGGIQAFIQYVRSFTQPITQMANISNHAADRLWRRPSGSSNSWTRRRKPTEEPKPRIADLDIQGNV